MGAALDALARDAARAACACACARPATISSFASTRPDAPDVDAELVSIDLTERAEQRMTTGLAILAVDDEPRALADVPRLLESSASVDRVATATSAKEALVSLSRRPLRRALPRRRHARDRGHGPRAAAAPLRRPARRRVPHGHPDAAVEAFEVQALDFLVKPVTRERLDAALRRVEAQRPHPAPAPRGRRGGGDGRRARRRRRRGRQPRGGGKRLVRVETIAFAQANGDYARIVCEDGRFLLRTPLTQLEKDWAPAGFARVHRAYS